MSVVATPSEPELRAQPVKFFDRKDSPMISIGQLLSYWLVRDCF